jgi:hypothetical protein
LTEDEIGSLTPLLFFALLKRKQNADRQEYVRAGLVAAAVMNFSMGHPDKPVTELDFVPGWLKEQEVTPVFDLQQMSPEAQAAYVKKQFSKRIYLQKG